MPAWCSGCAPLNTLVSQLYSILQCTCSAQISSIFLRWSNDLQDYLPWYGSCKNSSSRRAKRIGSWFRSHWPCIKATWKTRECWNIVTFLVTSHSFFMPSSSSSSSSSWPPPSSSSSSSSSASSSSSSSSSSSASSSSSSSSSSSWSSSSSTQELVNSLHLWHLFSSYLERPLKGLKPTVFLCAFTLLGKDEGLCPKKTMVSVSPRLLSMSFLNPMVILSVDLEWFPVRYVTPVHTCGLGNGAVALLFWLLDNLRFQWSVNPLRDLKMCCRCTADKIHWCHTTILPIVHLLCWPTKKCGISRALIFQ